jgi:predicted outer membrane repeat protein
MEKSEYRHGIELDVDGLVINGNGHSIDANAKTKIFECKGEDITLKNVSLKNGFSSFGGAITNTKGKLSIIGSIFKSNGAMNGGRAIYAEHRLVAGRCSFESNTADKGGAIWAENSEWECKLKDCTFKDNKPDDICDD